LIEDSGSNFLLKAAFFHFDVIRSDGSGTLIYLETNKKL
jgi:hypothetical protein